MRVLIANRHLVTIHAILDEEGKPVISEDGTFQLTGGTDLAEFLTLREQLLDSVAEVDGPTYAAHPPSRRNLPRGRGNRDPGQ